MFADDNKEISQCSSIINNNNNDSDNYSLIRRQQDAGAHGEQSIIWHGAVIRTLLESLACSLLCAGKIWVRAKFEGFFRRVVVH